jgi:hypothetical protein
MSSKNSYICPSCGVATEFTKRATYEKLTVPLTHFEVGECNSCNFFVLIERHYPRGGQEFIANIYPRPLPPPVNPRTPDFLKPDFEEARLCYSVGAFKSAAVLARRALQLCCIEKKAPDKVLKDQIDWMLSQYIITKDISDWASEVRLVGNDSAHSPKKIEENKTITSKDAEDILVLLEKFIDVLYIAPKIAEERRDSRLVSELSTTT